jgi:hypothetical protein
MPAKTGSEKACEWCGKVSYVPGWRLNKYKFCSFACLHAGRPKRQREGVEVECACCGKMYYVPQYRRNTTKTCSYKCHAQLNQEKLIVGRLKFWKENPRPKIPEEERIKRKRIRSKRLYERQKDQRSIKAKENYAANNLSIRLAIKEDRKLNPEKYSNQSRKARAKNPERARARRRQDYRNHKVRYVAAARKREAEKLQRTPPWADLKKIEEFYALAARLTKETGIKHHVDHIYPLRGKTVSGLHVHTNLQVIPALDNLKKSNRIPEGVFND